MQLIAAADKNWGIGIRDSLLVRIPADMRQFKEKTTGHPVLYGRKTLSTFPKGKILPGRRNLILTRNPEFTAEGAQIVHSVEEAAAAAPPDTFVIGGGEIYREMLPYCDMAYITRLDYVYEADTFMPDLTSDPAWDLIEESDEQTYFDLIYTFQTYRRRPA